ncbi:MAG TPA: response regulator [Pyrinomonadaceae bacterium]|jgi:CheY-like chemotaxis protein
MSSASAAALAPDPAESYVPEPDLQLHLVKRRALVVDDSPDVADMLTIVLREAGYEVETTYSASQALMAAFTRRFDVIISDIGMPGMDGYELARRLRELPEYRATPMVAVTGFASYDDRERSLGEGFTAHLSKPVDPATLTRALSGFAH